MKTPPSKAWLPVLIVYVVIDGVMFALGFRRPLELLLVPLLILSGWAFFGHFITLDDDFPGGWSNPARSRTLWGASLLQLCIKGIIFAVLMLVVVLLR